jgi:hypothetical protein
MVKLEGLNKKMIIIMPISAGISLWILDVIKADTHARTHTHISNKNSLVSV